MTITRAMFSSERHDWETPQDLFDKWAEEFGITFDVCATPENAKTARYFTSKDDALSRPWPREVCWMNPPYGDAIKHWMDKARAEAALGSTVVCLVPSRTDTQWWQRNVENEEGERKAAIVRFIKGRIRFVGAETGALFPSALVVFKP